MTSICQKTVVRDKQIDSVHPGKGACNITKCTVVLWWPCLCDRNPSLLTGGCLLQPQLVLKGRLGENSVPGTYN